MDTIVAIPSNHPGGLDADLSDHFGHCDVFTLITFGEDGVTNVEVVPPADHAQGGCQAPVDLLAGHGVHALIARGMGRRPLAAFAETGILVLHAGDAARVGESVDALRAGRLARFDLSSTCGGH